MDIIKRQLHLQIVHHHVVELMSKLAILTINLQHVLMDIIYQDHHVPQHAAQVLQPVQEHLRILLVVLV